MDSCTGGTGNPNAEGTFDGCECPEAGPDLEAEGSTGTDADAGVQMGTEAGGPTNDDAGATDETHAAASCDPDAAKSFGSGRCYWYRGMGCEVDGGTKYLYQCAAAGYVTFPPGCIPFGNDLNCSSPEPIVNLSSFFLACDYEATDGFSL